MKPSGKLPPSILAVGDIHFNKDAKLQGDELIDRLLVIAKEAKPSIIVLLGDIMDTHETVKNVPWKQAEALFKGLSELAHTYVLIGNHDLCSASEFLTDNHFFNPYKVWNNITIVDKPLKITLSGKKFVLCPYVSPGRFVEALNTLFDEGEDWRDATCIFGHQEFAGAIYNDRDSVKGDAWSDELPPVISGHIHEECQIGDNIFYVGSSRQVKFNENPIKKVWKITFGAKRTVDKIELGLKAKKEVELDYEDVKTFDFGMCESYYIKLKIKGDSEQFKLFRKHPLHAKLIRSGVKIHFVNKPAQSQSLVKNLASALKDQLSFENILGELVKGKRPSIQDAYNEVYLANALESISK